MSQMEIGIIVLTALQVFTKQVKMDAIAVAHYDQSAFGSSQMTVGKLFSVVACVGN